MATFTGTTGADSWTGGGDDDTAYGLAGDDSLAGGDGADVLEGGEGADTLDGGAGVDTVSYAGATSAVAVDLGNPANNSGDAAGDVFSSIEIIKGSAYADSFSSSAASNSIFQGGAGDDVYTVDSGSDVVNESAGEGTDHVLSTANAYTLSANVETLTFIGTGDFTGSGNADANSLTGGAGNDALVGGAGADVLDGAGGVNTASYATAAAGLAASLANPSGNSGDAAGDTYVSIQNLTGSGFADTLTGDSQGNVISGGGGDDVLEGGAGADTLDGGSGTDTVSFAGASAGVVVDLSNAANNAGDAAGDSFTSIEVFQGSAYADTFVSAAGINTTFQGGAGDDLYKIDSASDVVTEAAGQGADTVQASSSSYTLSANLEALVFTGSGAFTGTGNAGDNAITGGAGDDVLIGGGGADALEGAGGVNTASYATAAGGIAASLANPGGNTGDAAGDTYAHIQNLTGSGFADTLGGDSQNNLISGGGGADLLEGGAGADTLDGGAGSDTASYAGASAAVKIDLGNLANNSGDAAGDSYSSIESFQGSAFNDTLVSASGINSAFAGGAGDDVYTVDSTSDVVVEASGEGTDTVLATSSTYTLSANVEVLTFTGSGAFTGIGNSGANSLTGGAGDDILIGAGGADSLDGAGGVNTASYSTAAAGLLASLANPSANSGDAAGDSYANIQNLTGSAFADTLTGDSQNNVLNGGAGADALDGGGGTNTASYANAAAGVLASLASSGANTGEAAGDTYANIQNLAGSGFGDVLVGNSGANSLSGGAGDDELNGGLGGDALDGGSGNNTASYYNATTTIVANLANAAVNTNEASGDSYTNIQNLTGGAYNDTITGDAQDNILMGSGGADVMDGAGGNNTASYANAPGAVVASLANRLSNTGDAAGDVYTSIQNLTGSAYADTLTGDSGANILRGGGGDDLLTGGAGADAMDGGTGVNTASYAAETSQVLASLANSASNSGEAAGDTYANIQNLTGGNFNDTLVGDSQNNVLTGGGANDVLNGGVGADTLDGGAGTDTASYANAASGVYVDSNTPANNTGEAAGDSYTSIEVFQGSAFNDTFAAVGGTATFKGGAGDDAYYVGTGTATVTENASEGTDSVYCTATGYTLGANVENLYFTGSGDFAGTGNAINNLIVGGSGSDTLIGAGGADTLDGGSGIDTVSYATSTAVLANLANNSANTGDATGDVYLHIRNITGGNGADTLIGDAGDNVISGGNGNDLMMGGGGNDSFAGSWVGGSDFGDYVSYQNATSAVNVDFQNTANNTGEAAGDSYYGVEGYIGTAYNDTFNSITSTVYDTVLKGGLGNDAYYVDTGNDLPTENAGEGADTVFSQASAFTLGANIEVLTFIGSGNFTGTGNASANTITGGAGDDVLMGAGGADTLVGGAGVNTASYATSTAVLANLANPAANTGDAAGDSYSNIANLTGGTGADTLIGDSHDNTLSGGAGNDLLMGGGGNDYFVGSAVGGSDFADIVSYQNASSAVNLDLQNGANNTGEAAGDTFYGIERFIGTAYNDTFNSITSTTYDTALIGGQGNDTYYVDGNDPITENAGEGIDSVFTTIATYTLGANLENLTFTGSGNFSGTGNSAANAITGGNGDDTLVGGAGADTLSGGGGTDTVTYASASAAVVANLASPGGNTGDAAGDTYSSIENLVGSGFADTLTGDSGNNSLTGGSGNDILVGGSGVDFMGGGTGNDTYVFSQLSDSSTSAPDQIVDWNTGDKIDLSAIDADTTTAGDQAFHLDGTTGGAGDISFAYSGGLGCTVVSIWVDNDATVDMVFYIGGNVTLTSASFVL